MKFFHIIFIFILAVNLSIYAKEKQGQIIEKKLIPIALSARPQKITYKPNEPILITLKLENNFESGNIFYECFSVIPNDWNAETLNVDLVDIYREGTKYNLYSHRPELNTPITVAGVSLKKISAGQVMEIIIDAKKWKLRDGWLPGKYRITCRLNNIIVDEYSTLSITSDPISIDMLE